MLGLCFHHLWATIVQIYIKQLLCFVLCDINVEKCKSFSYKIRTNHKLPYWCDWRDTLQTTSRGSSLSFCPVFLQALHMQVEMYMMLKSTLSPQLCCYHDRTCSSPPSGVCAAIVQSSDLGGWSDSAGLLPGNQRFSSRASSLCCELWVSGRDRATN